VLGFGEVAFPKAGGVGVEAMEIWEPVEVENPARERNESDGGPKCPGAFGEVTRFSPNSLREIEGSANHAAEEKIGVGPVDEAHSDSRDEKTPHQGGCPKAFARNLGFEISENQGRNSDARNAKGDEDEEQVLIHGYHSA
jgi:hypothetical protein